MKRRHEADPRQKLGKVLGNHGIATVSREAG
jgi:hypothetical protein